MCLLLHLTTFHFLPSKAINLTLQIVEVTTAQSTRAGRNGAEWYPGPQSCRHSWHLIRFLCVIVNQWCPFSLKIPYGACLLSAERDTVHSGSHVLSASPCCTPGVAARSPSTDDASAPLPQSEAVWAEEERRWGRQQLVQCVQRTNEGFFSHASGQYLVVLLAESQK